MATRVNRLEDNYDVLIVGSGPAGAGVARALSDSGLRTAVVERAGLPRHKVCSGIVFPSARKMISDNFGDLPEEVFCSPKEVWGNRMYLTNESDVLEIPWGVIDPGEGLPQHGWNTHRSKLDLWLCEQSDASIADECLFMSYRTEKNGIRARVRHKGEYLDIGTRFLVGADGLRSRVRRCVAPAKEKEIGWLPVYEEWYRGDINLEPGFLYFFVDRRVTDLFATVFHKEDLIHVSVLVNEGKSAKQALGRLRDFLEKRHGLDVKDTVGTCGIVKNDMTGTRNYVFGEGNVLVAGEANGVIESIAPCLATGKAAGQAILESVATGRTAHDCFLENPLLIAERDKGEKLVADLKMNLGLNFFSVDD